MMKAFVEGVYPCGGCRHHFRKLWNLGEGKKYSYEGRIPALKTIIPIDDIKTKEDAMIWVWKIHNAVSLRLYHSSKEDSLGLLSKSI